MKGEVVQRAPEFEDCKFIAETYSVPLKKVYEQVWKELKKREN
jgi:pyridinium-3,5-bisthiocarboxylic acid mononucleotide nickel chelatase